MAPPLTVGSCFAGIGGFDLAASRVWGWDCVKWQVEIDPFCQRVLAKHWPDVRRYSDIRELTGDELEPVDLICGGFPCQDISRSNQRRRGLAGERSGLWFNLVRLLRALRPRWVVLENVPAHVLAFWREQPFDLGLEHHPLLGTYRGNCDGCFLKKAAKIKQIARESPEVIRWWAGLEQLTGCTFRRDRFTYTDLAAGRMPLEFNFSELQEDELTCLVCTD